ncbi:MAG: DUF2892 domain-containing protein [Pseudomonadota bacterium]
MKSNLSGVDRIIRLILAAVFLGNGIYYNWWWVLAIGGVLLLTGIGGRCPVYRLFNLSSKGHPTAEHYYY